MAFLNAHTHFSKYPESEILHVSPNQICNSFHSSGIHPWDSACYTTKDLHIGENCVAIGEIGLDRLQGPELAIQRSLFEAQVLLSEELELPVILHCVKAWSDVLNVRRKLRPKQPWIFHGFQQSAIVEQVTREGLLLSLGAGIMTHPKAESIVSQIPDAQLLLETDDRDTDIEAVYVAVAALKKISLQALEAKVANNFQNTFKKWHTGLNVRH